MLANNVYSKSSFHLRVASEWNQVLKTNQWELFQRTWWSYLIVCGCNALTITPRQQWPLGVWERFGGITADFDKCISNKVEIRTMEMIRSERFYLPESKGNYCCPPASGKGQVIWVFILWLWFHNERVHGVLERTGIFGMAKPFKSLILLHTSTRNSLCSWPHPIYW